MEDHGGSSSQGGETLLRSGLGPDRSVPIHRAWPPGWGRRMVILAVLSGAAALRLGNLGTPSLPHDEAWRANLSHHGALAEARRFPPLQYALLWSIQRFVGRTEFLLRLPCALAGIFCVLVLYQLSRRHLNEGSALLVGALAACQPVLVLHARTMKVFSFEALMTAVIVWAGLEAYRSLSSPRAENPSGTLFFGKGGPHSSSRSLFLFLAAALVGLGFTFTSSLVVAAWVPVLGWASWRRDKTGHRALGGFIIVAALLGVAVAGWYVWLAGCPYRAGVIKYFGAGRNMGSGEPVWPRAYTLPVLAVWLVTSIRGATEYLLHMSDDWPPLSWCIATVEVLAMAASIGIFWKRHRPLCIFAIILAVEVLLAGAFREWPFGKIRTTTFLVPIVVMATGCGLWYIIQRLGSSVASMMIIVLCILIPTTQAARTYLISPSFKEHLRPAWTYLRSHLNPDDSIFVYYGAIDSFEYYGDFNRILRNLNGTGPARIVRLRRGDLITPVLLQPLSDRGHFTIFAQRFDEWIKQHGRVWFLFTHNWKNEREEWISHLENQYKLLDTFQTSGASAHLFTR